MIIKATVICMQTLNMYTQKIVHILFLDVDWLLLIMKGIVKWQMSLNINSINHLISVQLLIIRFIISLKKII